MATITNIPNIFPPFPPKMAETDLIRFCTWSPSRNANYALLLFSYLQYPNLLTFNIILQALSSSSFRHKTLVLYHYMIRNVILPNNYTYPFLLKAHASFYGIKEGK
ncbi:hypothetical protein MRB53_005773 [Persea americana]|uniref:Uncharacterized protein n=1 Tax=Persea americana TaxID=3435 RepID=A0ACC2MED1_PERAE|nr:hypothetical protein MRB53_005773 [Persea americana]